MDLIHERLGPVVRVFACACVRVDVRVSACTSERVDGRSAPNLRLHRHRVHHVHLATTRLRLDGMTRATGVVLRLSVAWFAE